MTQSVQSSNRKRVARGELAQLNISPGGMPKLPIESARVTVDGVPGDWQTNRKHHGGPDRAICLFSHELYDWLRDDFAIDLKFGSVGENFTTRGIDLLALRPGDRLRIGESCTIEITDIRIPCGNLKRWDQRLLHVIQGKSGWVAKVVVEGDVKTGDAVEVIRQ
ncbi:MOSC domain-containing protein [soil metagenome]